MLRLVVLDCPRSLMVSCREPVPLAEPIAVGRFEILVWVHQKSPDWLAAMREQWRPQFLVQFDWSTQVAPNC